MNGHALYALEHQPVTTDQRGDGVHGEVAEMLVIDRVELGPSRPYRAQYGASMTATPPGASMRRDAAHEAVEIGDVRHDVETKHDVGSRPVSHHPRGEIASEELDDRRDVFLVSATAAMFAAGSIPSTGTPAFWKYCSR